MTLTKTLINVLNGEEDRSVNTTLLIDYAINNKILLELLRTLSIDNALRMKQETGLINIYESLMEIAKRIQDMDYAVIKFFKPVAYVPSDIDLLVKREHVKNMLRMLQGIGYKPSVFEPNCISLVGKTIVDIYINPDFINIPYMSGEKLLKYVQIQKINGVKVKKLRPEAEVILTLSHAIYKEQIVTLNDYYTAKCYLNDKSVEIAEELMVLNALAYSLKLFEDVELGLLETPIRVPILHAAKMILSKIAEDPLSKKYLPYAFSKFFDRRTPMLFKSRLLRQTY